MKIILEAAKENPRVLEEPAAGLIFADFGPTFAEFRLTFWLADVSDSQSVSSELRSTIARRFAAEEIELLPQAAIVASSIEGDG
jgi:potassium efflux system protein